MSGISPMSAVLGGSSGVWTSPVTRTNYPQSEALPPVEPVKAVTTVQREVATPQVQGDYHELPTILEGADPIEMSVRARIGKGESTFGDIMSALEKAESGAEMGDMEWMSAFSDDAAMLYDPAEMAVRSRINYASDSEIAQMLADLGQLRGDLAEAKVAESSGDEKAVEGLESADHVHSSECQTCQNRTYVDGSEDGSVSYQTPTHISPEDSASKVSAHEQEHVVNEQAYAERDGREVVSQNVQIFKDICPECGISYTSGGLTTTVTQEKQGENDGGADSVATSDSSGEVA